MDERIQHIEAQIENLEWEFSELAWDDPADVDRKLEIQIEIGDLEREREKMLALACEGATA